MLYGRFSSFLTDKKADDGIKSFFQLLDSSSYDDLQTYRNKMDYISVLHLMLHYGTLLMRVSIIGHLSAETL